MIVKITNPENPEEEYEYFLDDNLKKYLDKYVKKDLEQEDKDYVMLIDGYEGSGKSTFASQVARYIDPTFNLSRMCMTAQQFKEAIVTSKKNKAIIYDEAGGLSGGKAITKIGKILKSMMMQMRQKNLFVIVIMPIIFEFSKYAVLSRAKAFFHIYESKGRRGYWVGYNKRDLRNLYLLGKVTYIYRVRSFFKGRFYGKWAISKEQYLKKKEENLFLLEEEEGETKKDTKYMKQRDLIVKGLYNEFIPNQKKLSKWLLDNKVTLAQRTISQILQKSIENPVKQGKFSI